MLQTVSRAIRCLIALSEHQDGLTLTELASRVGSNKATVHRIVKTLDEFGFVTTVPRTRRLRLGSAVLTLHAAFSSEAEIRELARPHLTRLRDKTGETSCLHLPLGKERVCVAQVESRAELRWVANVGTRFPLTAGAPGKVLVAFLPPDERERVLRSVPLARFTPYSITDRHQFERVLDQVRADGYGTALNENIQGSAACSAPVLDHGGRVVAAVTIIGSAEHLSPPLLKTYSRLVRQAADAISADLRHLVAGRRGVDGGPRRASSGGGPPSRHDGRRKTWPR